MKVKEYREMMSYLTRPGTPDQDQKDMETQVKKSVENNKNPGTFKKLVKEDEAAYRKKNVQGYLPGLEPEKINKLIETYDDPDPVMEKRGQQTVAQPKKKIEPYYMQNINGGIDDVNNPRGPITKKFDNKKISVLDYIEKVKSNYNEPGPSIQQQVINYSPKKIVDVEKTLEKYEDNYVSKRGDQTIALINTADKLKGAANKNDYILKEDRNGLMVNKNRTIAVRDSFVAKQFNNALGGVEPTNVQKFEKNSNNINSKKPIIKKPFKRTGPIEPLKINIDDYKHFAEPHRTVEDPRFKVMEARFKELERKNQQEKIRIKNSGLAGLIGKKIYE